MWRRLAGASRPRGDAEALVVMPTRDERRCFEHASYTAVTVSHEETTFARRRAIQRGPGESAGRWLIIAAVILFAIIAAPVVIRGGLLADDYVICMRPIHQGYGPYIDSIWHDTGVVRPARFIELFLISRTCKTVPFGLAILVPLALKFGAAALLYGLLRDLRLRAPWPAIGTAMWLLEPVGTEAALWPSALHVLLGLTLTLAALRLYHRGAIAWGGVATLASALSVEQAIFAIPLAVWLLTPPAHRRRATTVAFVTVAIVLLAYSIWPGQNPRQAVSLAQRLHNIYAQPDWYLFFPATGVGVYSGTIAFLWAFPYSMLVVGLGAAAGAWYFPVLLADHDGQGLDRSTLRRGVLSTGALVLLVNLPLIVTEVGYSARTFTPTWLVLSGATVIGAAQVKWKRIRLMGVLSGMFAAFAVLSLVLSVSVRLRTNDFDRAAAWWIAERTHDGDVVAFCNVGRTVVDPAPLGAFHLPALNDGTADWIDYYTGRVVSLRRSGLQYWGARCPDLTGADLVVDFPTLEHDLGF
jgi:hypothetical protein